MNSENLFIAVLAGGLGWFNSFVVSLGLLSFVKNGIGGRGYKGISSGGSSRAAKEDWPSVIAWLLMWFPIVAGIWFVLPWLYFKNTKDGLSSLAYILALTGNIIYLWTADEKVDNKNIDG
jgi:hypothetical protein